MNILITGGAGYIGAELAKSLAANDAVESIAVYDNLSRGNYNLFLGEKKFDGKLKFVHADILDSRNLKKNLKSTDVVYHCAAKVTTPFSNLDANQYEQINHWGTAELIYALEESDVKKLIFISSSAVYGDSQNPVDETTLPNPSSFYGISKLRAEEHVTRLFEKIETIILRCSNVYGYSSNMRFDAVINKLMFDANFFNHINISGNGNQFRSFIHIDKVTDVLGKLCTMKIPSGVYNLADKNLEIISIVEVLRDVFPDLEFQFLNQHIQMQHLQVASKGKLAAFIPLNETDLKEELIEFKKRFSFEF